MATLSVPPKYSAALQVLHTTELFELVVSSLDVSNLVNCTEVCKQWNSIIKSSPTLKHWMWKDQLLRLMPVVEGVARPSIPQQCLVCNFHHNVQPPSNLNPIIASYFKSVKIDSARFCWQFYDDVTMELTFKHKLGDPILAGGFQLKIASCRNMYLFIPGIKKLRIRGIYTVESLLPKFRRILFPFGSSRRERTTQAVDADIYVANDDGIRMGEFLDAISDTEKYVLHLERGGWRMILDMNLLVVLLLAGVAFMVVSLISTSRSAKDVSKEQAAVYRLLSRRI